MNKEVFAPFEIQNGYASDRFLRKEASRAGEVELKQRPSQRPAPRDPNLLSRTEWKARGRKVRLPDSSAAKVIVTKNGHKLCLFNESQTVSV